MPSIKPLSYFVALAVASIAYPQQSFANTSGEIWDCKASASGSWDCDRKPAPTVGLATTRSLSTEKAKGPVATSAKELPSYKTLDWVKVHRHNQVCQIEQRLGRTTVAKPTTLKAAYQVVLGKTDTQNGHTQTLCARHRMTVTQHQLSTFFPRHFFQIFQIADMDLLHIQ